MVKLAIVLGLALCVLGLSYGLYQNVLLANWSISTEQIPTPIREGGGCPLLPAAFLKERKFIVSLSREDDEKVVAIVEGKKDGSAVLNPRMVFGNMRYNYGPIPEVFELTKNQADILFGKSVKQSSDTYSYRLSTPFPKNEKKLVFLDLQFQNNKIQKFRIRSQSFQTTNWTTVQKEVEGAA